MHSTEFYDSVKNTGARQPSSIVSRMRIDSRREYFCLVNFQFTSESKTENCKQGPQGPEKKHPFFQFRVQAQKHPFFRFRVQAHENNPCFQNREHAKKKTPFYAKFGTIMRTRSQYRVTTPGKGVNAMFFVQPLHPSGSHVT